MHSKKSFISASSEKIHAFIHSNMHFSKKKVQNFIMRFVKKKLSFQNKKRKKTKRGKCGESFVHGSLN